MHQEGDYLGDNFILTFWMIRKKREYREKGLGIILKDDNQLMMQHR